MARAKRKPKRTPKRKKKTPARGGLAGVAATATGRDRAPKASPKKPARVKPAKAARATKLKPARKPGKLSKHPEAARSRKRRGRQREEKRKAELAREKKNRRARERRLEEKAKARKKRGKRRTKREKKLDETEIARGWLEMVHERISEVFTCDLDITIPGGGAARPEDRERERAGGPTPWLVVGRFDPTEEVDYQILARGLAHVESDDILTATINPDRLSQLRVIFADPKANRGEGDAVLSHIGAWSFILGDAIADLVGSDLDTPDEGSLAARYQETTVPMFYVFFSTELVRYTTAWGGGVRGKTQEVKLR